ncbi:MAG TPA: 3-dehydro-L-gulonate 2-dehydrogenase [Mucilaginibacter sp.]|jgi:3-dehydro-L-gulonate 2-dehydrogenase|nr:3-dehydro-L-gulonate 2-dehydrogenase [Mucilaginibacter sp.]
MLVPFEDIKSEFIRVLLANGFSENKADEIAQIFAENSRDGVHSHGLNRFPTFIQYVKDGHVIPDAEPVKDGGFGSLEQWDGQYGPGMLNAKFCMNRAIELANENGIGCIAIRNTNHWMRGGTYGWQAAEAGMISISFTNTIANMPPWGGIDPRLGNNPLIIAVPRKEGHVVLDMAMSQYAIGKLNLYKSKNEQLPLPGGYDQEGHLSTDPAAILESERVLPIGFWKGSGLSLILDLLATILSQGRSTAAITQAGPEAGVSQVFIAIKPIGIKNMELIEQILDYAKSSRLLQEGHDILYPGENTLRTREKSMKDGVWVDERIWEKVKAL